MNLWVKPGLTIILGGSPRERRGVAVSLLQMGEFRKRWCYSRSLHDDSDIASYSLVLQSVSSSLTGSVEHGNQVVFFCSNFRDLGVQTSALSFLSPVCSTVLVVDVPNIQDDERFKSGLMRMGLMSSVDWGEYPVASALIFLSPCEKLRRLGRAMTGRPVPGGSIVVV